jgi:hypothetical protein
VERTANGLPLGPGVRTVVRLECSVCRPNQRAGDPSHGRQARCTHGVQVAPVTPHSGKYVASGPDDVAAWLLVTAS